MKSRVGMCIENCICLLERKYEKHFQHFAMQCTQEYLKCWPINTSLSSTEEKVTHIRFLSFSSKSRQENAISFNESHVFFFFGCFCSATLQMRQGSVETNAFVIFKTFESKARLKRRETYTKHTRYTCVTLEKMPLSNYFSHKHLPLADA